MSPCRQPPTKQARALIREAQAALFPTLSASYTATRTHIGAAASGSASATSATNRYGPRGPTTSTFVPGVSGSWDLDVWGKVRRQIESNASAAQVSAADLANVTLSAQAQLATAYFNLRRRRCAPSVATAYGPGVQEDTGDRS